jgi:hypothetical protein
MLMLLLLVLAATVDGNSSVGATVRAMRIQRQLLEQ